MVKLLSSNARRGKPLVRRARNCSLLTLGLVIGFLSGQVVAAERGITLAHPFRPDSVLSEWGRFIQQDVAKSAGVRVEVIGAGKFGRSEDLYEAVNSGYVDMAIVSAEVLAERSGGWNVLSIPTLVPDDSVSLNLRHSDKFRRALEDVLSDRGAVATTVVWRPRGILSTVNPIRTPQDLRGRKVSAYASDRRFLESVGASTVRLFASEVPQALMVGVIDSVIVDPEVWSRGAIWSQFEGGYLTWSLKTSVFSSAYVLIVSRNVELDLGNRRWESFYQGLISAADEFERYDR